MIRIVQSSNRRAVRELLGATAVRDKEIAARAAAIVQAVRTGGDAAVLRYAKQLDGLAGPIEIPRSHWVPASLTLPAAVRAALRRAALNIRRVSRAQAPRGFRLTVEPGVSVEQRVIPLDRVGCYVPGGRYPLPSSLLMTAIPARVAGVEEVIAVCPRPDAAVLAAALEAGVDRLFHVGGAHAIAALAYGTKTIPRVDKIVGPGNQWVSAAKALVSGDCAIDFYAGPTEIVIVSGIGPASWIAADLIAQAEHDPDARAVFITASKRLAESVAVEVARRVPADGPAMTALWRHGGIIVTESMDEAIELANAAAPEHLVVGSESVAAKARAAGAIFIGPTSAQVAGDYATGSSHVLPTAGAARFRGGLHASDFVRLVMVQRLTKSGLQRIAGTVKTLARAEGLTSHAASIEVRVPDEES